MKPHEVQSLPAWCLRLIVLMEARAAPRLLNVEGLWRRSTRKRSGTMTEFIRDRALLPPLEIDAIVSGAPVALVEFQAVAAQFPVEERPPLREWIDPVQCRCKSARGVGYAFQSVSNSSPELQALFIRPL